MSFPLYPLPLILQVLFFSLQGFSIIRTSIPSYLIWVYWAFNPLPYGIRALCINEMMTPAWGAAGPAILETFGLYTDRKWIWIGVGYMWAYLIMVTVLGTFALLWTNPPQPKPSGKFKTKWIFLVFSMPINKQINTCNYCMLVSMY